MCLVTLFERLNRTPPPPPSRPGPLFLPAVFSQFEYVFVDQSHDIFLELKLLPYVGLPCCKLSCDIALVPNAKNKIKTKIQLIEESIVGLYHLAPNVLVKFLVCV